MADSITTAVQSEVSALAHRHLTFTWGLVGVIILLMALMGFGGYMAIRSFDKQLAKQEARDTQYQADRKTFLDQLTAHDAERAAQASQIASLEAQIAHRNAQPLPKEIQAGLKPDSTSQAVAMALQTAYSDMPSFGVVVAESPVNVSLSLPQAQQVVQDKVDLNVTRADLKDTQAVVDLQKTANSSLTSDLGQCKDLNVKAQADIAGFKKLATRSKFRKFLDGAEKVALFAAGAYVGHKI
jgi:cell division protein FtsB